ncbi:MAG: hypothetical protein ABIZ04_14735 [Opitutus sp.]
MIALPLLQQNSVSRGPVTRDASDSATTHQVERARLQSSRVVRLCYFNTWAGGLEDAAAYAMRAPKIDLAPLVANPRDASLLVKARLDCDWYGENTRCFASLVPENSTVLPAWVCGSAGIPELAQAPREPGEERWLVFMGHQPQALGSAAGRAFSLLSKLQVKLLFYGFDEASRMMPCFDQIAPYLDVFIHDESPIGALARSRLKKSCLQIHRSWVANLVPFSVPFNEAPEERIFFLGSQLGLTENRVKQIDHLNKIFKDRFVAFHDHSVAVSERAALNRFKVSVCPEGRKFTTPAMSKTHTDRPFWSGCLGLVPVSENSKAGDRLQELCESSLLIRYKHGDLKTLSAQCERALATPLTERRRIYEHFNCKETVGTVVADAIAACAPSTRAAS